MKQLGHRVFVRQRHNWILFLRFGVVGASGVLVNMAALIALKRLGPDPEHVWIDLPGLVYNVRWYHVFATASFLVANLWNFQLNRAWTFASRKHVGWWREYLPFLSVGLMGLLVSLLIITLLMNVNSPIALSRSVFDGRDGFRTPLYWANLIAIAVVTPLSFVLNKLWTFSGVRTQAGGRGA